MKLSPEEKITTQKKFELMGKFYGGLKLVEFLGKD